MPPDILNQPDVSSANLEEGVTSEGGTIQLVCRATGVPDPTVIWKRENGKDIVLRNEGRDKQGEDEKFIFELYFGFFFLLLSSVLKNFKIFCFFVEVVKHVDGERLIMHQVSRMDMGGYYCIASNGIPPTVSKRFDVQINCKFQSIFQIISFCIIIRE